MWDITIHYSVFWLRHCMSIENSGKIVQHFCIHEYDLHNVIEKLQASSLEWNGNTNMFSSQIRWLTHLTIPLVFLQQLCLTLFVGCLSHSRQLMAMTHFRQKKKHGSQKSIKSWSKKCRNQDNISWTGSQEVIKSYQIKSAYATYCGKLS